DGPARRPVLVLWFDEGAANDAPIARLAQLLAAIVPPDAGRSLPKIPVRVVGPRTSNTLQRLAIEAARGNAPAMPPGVGEVRYLAATPTADDARLLEGLTAPGQWLSGFPATPPGVTVVRTTLSDRRLCDALVAELGRRGVDVDAAAGGRTPVAIVTEFDTLYGRSIEQSFGDAVRARSAPPGAAAPGAGGRSPVFAFHYLRGIDGRVSGGGPGGGGPGRPGAESDAATFAPTERPEGLDQADYLRRLAGRLRDLDAALRRDGTPLRAVGVLGSDVYDKVLTLRALRRELPGCLFFTTGLDARYALRSEWGSAHNLIVAADYGLTLRAGYQGTIPPFRDSLQTSVFATTLAAVGEFSPPGSGSLPPPELVGRTAEPRLVEIGRGGPYELTVEPDRRSQTDPLAHWDEARGGLATGSVHPPRPDADWPGSRRQRWLAAGLLAAVALTLLIGRRVGILPHAANGTGPSAPWPGWRHWREWQRWARARLRAARPRWLLWRVRVAWRRGGRERNLLDYGWLVTLGTAAVAAAAAVVLSRLDGMEGEPFTLTAGISVWPSFVIRAAAIALAASFVWKGWTNGNLNSERLTSQFMLQSLGSAAGRRWVAAHQARQSLWGRTKLNGWQVYGVPVVRGGGGDASGQRADDEMEFLTSHPGATLDIEDRIRPNPGINLSSSGGVPVPTKDADRRKNVSAQRLWWEFLLRCQAGPRALRVLVPTAISFVGLLLLQEVFGYPGAPVRGGWCWWADRVITVSAELSSLTLLFFVLDAAYLNTRVIEYLGKQTTTWPNGTFDHFRSPGLWHEDQTEQVDVRFVAARTRVVGDVVYYPFPVFFLLIAARMPLFDDWDWPIPLVLGLTFCVGMAAVAALVLRRAAEEVRRQSIRCVEARLRRAEAEAADDGPPLAVAAVKHSDPARLERLIADIRDERQGAFSILSNYPFLAAILLPSGGVGLWALLEQVPKLLD
ncbi:MAG: hypothetical protein JWO31_4094, partial [Phycisphaerales bacterium]|nr:hypothetical protein [Phycisphaerales bacterium]